ncbi:MAG: histidine phosphatase family protein, partial [Rhodobacteraceae bacterium]|nr:histidine phosphatase family protein [Paracoccaceae bacterium]
VHRLQGHADPPLDAEGRAEIADLRPPPSWREARLVTSPLARAQETAEAIARGRPVSTDARLMEMDFGVWEGLYSQALADDPSSGFKPIEDWGWSFRPPDGESVLELRERVTPFLQDVAAAGFPVLAVCHIGVMRVILAVAHGWDFEGPPPFRVKRRRLYPLRLTPQGLPEPDGPSIPLVSALDAPAKSASCG